MRQPQVEDCGEAIDNPSDSFESAVGHEWMKRGKRFLQFALGQEKSNAKGSGSLEVKSFSGVARWRWIAHDGLIVGTLRASRDVTEVIGRLLTLPVPLHKKGCPAFRVL